jgi:hypothetical protein
MADVCASFDTSASRPAQDDVEFYNPTNYVILSRAFAKARVEGRIHAGSAP